MIGPCHALRMERCSSALPTHCSLARHCTALHGSALYSTALRRTVQLRASVLYGPGKISILVNGEAFHLAKLLLCSCSLH
ncbi:hypothetical protein NDU88_005121 [Pleurodeles waltl]|uniref:Uncharacterized protein n=1 Tax=Pleurodeles waltl TaxID=8319 RepID=A0AAV7LKH3_PLEWA|nr:hypothetical protein NDU88_005121 [Pleurodeles waltl]